LSCFLSAAAFAGDAPSGFHVGDAPPPAASIVNTFMMNLGPSGKSAHQLSVLGLHKEREGEYLIITESGQNSAGGTYRLLRLESKEWVMEMPGKTPVVYVKVLK
jgi:hypothetical protein